MTVTALVPSGADAHTLELSPDGIRAIVEAELIVLNGAGLENAYLGTVEANADGPLLALAEGLELEEFPPGLTHENEEDGHEDEEEDGHEGEEEDGHGHDALDPHFWLDPELATQAVQMIRVALTALVPAAADEFHANASRYIGEIEAADAEVRALLAALPSEHRVLVTFHDAFGYFARRYDLEVFGFVVEGPEQEPSAAELADLVTEMQEQGITVVYHEPQFDSGVVRRVADETGAEVRTIYSQPFGAVATYTDVLRANARALAE